MRGEIGGRIAAPKMQLACNGWCGLVDLRSKKEKKNPIAMEVGNSGQPWREGVVEVQARR